MSATQLRRIALGLAVLLLLWGGSELLSRSDTVSGSLALPSLAPSDVDWVGIVKGADSIVLVQQAPGAWTVNGHRAASDGVPELLAALKDSVPPELVAEDSSSFGRLNVDSATGRWLRLRGRGKPLLQLIVGARGSEFQSTYVRRPGDRRVYLWRGRLAVLLDRTVDEWRDKRIAVLAPDSITALDVARGRDHYRLQRVATRWVLNGAAPDSAAVTRYLERLRAVTAAGFATRPQADSTRAREHTRRLTVRGVGGGVLLALGFDSTGTGFLVRHLAGRGGEGATVYRMNVWDVDGLTPAGRALLPAKR